MANLGKCPRCPAGTKDRILINGFCPHHAANPVPVEANDIPKPAAKKAPSRPKKSGTGKGAKRKAIKPVSAKLKAAQAEYSVRVAAWKLKPENKHCKALLKGCTVFMTDAHHPEGRGVHLLDEESWIPVCRSCHTWITEHSREAIEMGLSKPRLGRPAKK